METWNVKCVGTLKTCKWMSWIFFTSDQQRISYLPRVDSQVCKQDFCRTVNPCYPLWSDLCRVTSVLPVSCRCVSCTQCGATTPGLRCEWQNNYTQCAPCASLATCPICAVDYSEGTVIVQCRQCDRCAVFPPRQNCSLLILFVYVT